MLENKDLYEIISNTSGFTIKEIFLPSIILLFTSLLITFFNRYYLTKTEKGKYLIFIKNNSQPVSDFFQKISAYKSFTGINYFILLEGFLFGSIYSVKVISYIFSIADTLVNSFLTKIFPFLILYTSKSYDNMIESHVDFFVLVSTFNFFSLIVGMFIFIWLIFLEEKNYSLSRLTEKLYLTKWSIFVYYSYWFLAGIIIGVNLLIIFFTAVSFSYFSSITLSFSTIWIYLNSTFTNLITQMPAEKGSDIIINYVIGFIFSFSSLLILYNKITIFQIKFKKQITDFYITKFPYVTIKIESGEVNGQLHNFENKSMLMLNGNNVLKAVPWDQIRTMEINNEEEIQPVKITNCEALHPR